MQRLQRLDQRRAAVRVVKSQPGCAWASRWRLRQRGACSGSGIGFVIVHRLRGLAENARVPVCLPSRRVLLDDESGLWLSLTSHAIDSADLNGLVPTIGLGINDHGASIAVRAQSPRGQRARRNLGLCSNGCAGPGPAVGGRL
jgi:hypothetical protein